MGRESQHRNVFSLRPSMIFNGLVLDPIDHIAGMRYTDKTCRL